MPARLSKFVVNTTCKEYVHPWSNSCISASMGLGLHTFQESLRIYSTLYFIGLLTKKRLPSLNELSKTLLSILQSTAFLACSGFSYSLYICILRKLLGNFNIFTVSYIPSFLSSFTAILIERPSRHTMLCLYVTNIATEVLFRMIVSRGYISVVPKGEVFIFGVGMAVLMYFFKNKKNNDSIFKIIRFLLGKSEEYGYDPQYTPPPTRVHQSGSNYEQNKRFKKPMFNILWQSLRFYKHLIDRIKNFSSHLACRHPHSCIYYITTGSAKMFCFGLSAQVALKLIFQLKKLMSNPKSVKDVIFKKSNLNLAYFLGGFAGLYKLTSCYLRRTYNKDSPEFAIYAGFLASTSFILYSDNTIALYVLWKALQIMWNDGVENKKLPEVKWFSMLLYCLSTALLFHAAIVEPQNLRLSYWKFLYTISGGRIAMMSRKSIDEFGLETSKNLQKVFEKTHTHNNHHYIF